MWMYACLCVCVCVCEFVYVRMCTSVPSHLLTDAHTATTAAITTDTHDSRLLMLRLL
jgi:hypothetical protein